VRDRDTVIRSPHDATAIREGGKTRWVKQDPRVSVEMQEEGATVTLFFDPERALAGDAPLLEVRLTPTAGGEFAPWKLMAKLPIYTAYARASLTWETESAAAALRALRRVNITRRGMSDDQFRAVAETYESLIAEGERYPVKALAALQDVDKSTASRWISAARARGFLPASESEKEQS
jgi:hypothetical protein